MAAAASLSFVRILTILLGVAALLWGANVFLVFWHQAPVERTAGRIIAGERYPVDALVRQLPDVNAAELAPRCRPIVLRSAAIIRLRIFEEAVAAGQRDAIDHDMDSLRTALIRALGCSPADPFLWLVLYWAENTRSGFNLENLKYLRLSYRLGPNEGWIAERRNRLAVSAFERVPVDLAEMAVGEFARLLDTGLYEDVLSSLMAATPAVRETLLAGLKDVPEYRRRELAKRLYASGYDLGVPGINARDHLRRDR